MARAEDDKPCNDNDLLFWDNSYLSRRFLGSDFWLSSF